MNSNPTSFLAIVRSSGRAALQWRLLLLWLITLLIPTALLTLPFAKVFSAQLDYSIHSSELAQHLSANAINDLIGSVMISGPVLQQTGAMAFLLALLLSPFLSGTAITAARAQAPLAIGKLVHGGISEYWRLLRLMIVAILPLGIAIGISAGLGQWSSGVAEKAILESDADFASHIVLAVTIIVLLIADATLDAGRAQFAHSTGKRSALKAWWRGTKLVFKRPLVSLGLFIVITLIGVVLAALFGEIRMNIAHVNTGGFVIAFILAQLMVASIVWLKLARLFAFTALSKPN